MEFGSEYNLSLSRYRVNKIISEVTTRAIIHEEVGLCRVSVPSSKVVSMCQRLVSTNHIGFQIIVSHFTLWQWLTIWRIKWSDD